MKLRCDCEKLWATSGAEEKETEYRADCNGFDTEKKSALIAEEIKAILTATKKASP